MARLRLGSSEHRSLGDKRILHPPAEQNINTSEWKPTKRAVPDTRTNTDISSAEESDVPTKLALKSKQKAQKKTTQVRLVPLKSLKVTDMQPRRRGLRKGEMESQDGSRGQRKAKPLGSWRSEVSTRVETVDPFWPEDDLVEPVPEETIWYGSTDASRPSRDDEWPLPQKLLQSRPDTRRAPKEISPLRQPDLSKELRALTIFDTDDTKSPDDGVYPNTRGQDNVSRRASSSDQEENSARIRFSPPRSWSPHKREGPEGPPALSQSVLPSKLKLQSPSKRNARIPTPPYRSSIDAFWTAEAVNDWNDEYSPQKDLKSPGKASPYLQPVSPKASPTKNRSPTKRTKAEIEAGKRFDVQKILVAESFFRELDLIITGNQISKLAESTGGVQVIWSKTLNTTAGRANWRCETTKSDSLHNPGSIITTQKHFASVELATKVIANELQLFNVMAHEYCHLANFMISGVKDRPHGKSFKAWGAKVTRAFGNKGVEVTTKHNYEIEFRYIWRCGDEGCGEEYKRHSKSIDPKRHRCGVCKAQLLQIKPVPRNTGAGSGRLQQGNEQEHAAVTGYAGYVKQHFAAVKKGMPGRSHKEVMEALGKKYRADKAGVRTDIASLHAIAAGLDRLKLVSAGEVIEID